MLLLWLFHSHPHFTVVGGMLCPIFGNRLQYLGVFSIFGKVTRREEKTVYCSERYNVVLYIYF